MKKMIVIAVVLAALIVVGYSCGGGSSSGSSGDTTVKHIAVDPYIVGAKFFEDLDGDEVQDTGEQLSSLTDANGLFTFSSPLTTGSFIVLSNTVIGPLHNGVSYTGIVKREVTSITESLVASPLTTLLANGWTAENVVDVLTGAGLAGITVTDLTKNPMAGVNDLTAVTEAELVQIRSSIAIYSFLSIMDQIITGEGYALTYITFTNYAVTTTPALQAMVTSIKTCLSHTLLATIKSQMDGSGYTLPSVTAGDIIRTSVAMADWIIPQVVANPTGFDPTPSLPLYATMSYQLGVNFYIIRNKTNFIIQGALSGPAPSNPLKDNAIPGILTRDTLGVNDLP
ncbi:MAG: hypothetical protein HZA49_10670 [Planctomycetes bacterium]|nr:hypothetical protein [Planctomycetota bacterium]